MPSITWVFIGDSSRVLQRNRTNRIYMCIHMHTDTHMPINIHTHTYIKINLLWVDSHDYGGWDVSQSSQKSRNTGGFIQSESKGLTTRGSEVWILVWAMSHLSVWEISQLKKQWSREKKRKWCGQISSSFTFFIPVLIGLIDTPKHWQGQSTSLSPLIQTLSLSRNTLTDTQKCLIWATFGPVRLTHRINHCRDFFKVRTTYCVYFQQVYPFFVETKQTYKRRWI